MSTEGRGVGGNLLGRGWSGGAARRGPADDNEVVAPDTRHAAGDVAANDYPSRREFLRKYAVSAVGGIELLGSGLPRAVAQPSGELAGTSIVADVDRDRPLLP